MWLESFFFLFFVTDAEAQLSRWLVQQPLQWNTRLCCVEKLYCCFVFLLFFYFIFFAACVCVCDVMYRYSPGRWFLSQMQKLLYISLLSWFYLLLLTDRKSQKVTAVVSAVCCSAEGMGSPPITVTVCQCVFISVVVLILGVSTCKKRLWFIFNWLPLTEVSIWINSTWVEWISSCSGGQFLSLLFTSGYNWYCYITVRPPSNKNTPAPGLLVVNRELSPRGSQHLYIFTTTEKSHDQNALDSRVKCFSFIQNLILEESFNRGKKVPTIFLFLIFVRLQQCVEPLVPKKTVTYQRWEEKKRWRCCKTLFFFFFTKAAEPCWSCSDKSSLDRTTWLTSSRRVFFVLLFIYMSL